MDNHTLSQSSNASDMQPLLDRLEALEEQIAAQNRMIASLTKGSTQPPPAPLSQLTKRRNLFKIVGATVAAATATTLLHNPAPAFADTTNSHLVLLDTPLRLLDTRGYNSPPFTNGNSPMTPGLILPLDASQLITSPTGTVTSICGNVTVTNTQAPGFLTVYAKGLSTPGTSSINYFGAKQILSNFVITKVTTVPKGLNFVIECTDAGADVVFDITGYLTV